MMKTMKTERIGGDQGTTGCIEDAYSPRPVLPVSYTHLDVYKRQVQCITS